MTKERELLEKVISGDNKGDFFISYDLYKEIYEFLVHPEQSEQEPVTDKPTETAMAVMPNGVCVSNVYDAYEEGRKSVMVEQEPVAWMFGNKLYKKLYGKNHLSLEERNSFIPLYTAPPKREPLGLEIMDFCGSEDYREGFKDGALYAEKCHGIGGGE